MRRAQGITWALLALVFSLRFVALAQDPLLVSPSGMYLTDEGWYAKAAKNLVILRRADASRDFVPITHTFGYVYLCKLIFEHELSLLALRFFNLTLSGASVACLCWSIRNRWGDRLAQGAGIALSCNLLLISLTRLALPDTTAFALFTLAMAGIIPARRSVWLDLGCLSVAVAISFIKTSYAPATLWFTLVLAVMQLRKRDAPIRPKLTLRGLLSFALPLIALILGYGWIHLEYREAWDMFSSLNLQGRMVQGPIQWFLNLGYALGADLWSTGSLGLLICLILQTRQFGFKAFCKDPKVRALGLLLGLNFLARSLIWYHPPRYGLITALALVLLSLLAQQKTISNHPHQVKKLGRHWLGWFLVGQLPLCVAILQNGYSGDSMRNAVNSMATEIEALPHHPRVLYGTGSASYVSLFLPELHAVDVSENEKDLCSRIAHYGPGFLLVDDRKERDLDLMTKLDRCDAPMIRRELTSHLVLNDYYRQGPWRLYSLSRPGAPAKQ